MNTWPEQYFSGGASYTLLSMTEGYMDQTDISPGNLEGDGLPAAEFI